MRHTAGSVSPSGLWGASTDAGEIYGLDRILLYAFSTYCQGLTQLEYKLEDRTTKSY